MELAVDRGAAVPLGSQLAWQIQALIVDGRLQAGERLPSVRGLAAAVGVNVNTVRAVYERLEGEGFVRSEHGRGTFVTEHAPRARPEALRLYGQPPGPVPRPALLTTGELAQVRDDLVRRLEQLDAMRDEMVGILASLRTAIGEEAAPAASPPPASRPRIRPKPKPAY